VNHIAASADRTGTMIRRKCAPATNAWISA
jgi:hypothetical protein